MRILIYIFFFSFLYNYAQQDDIAYQKSLDSIQLLGDNYFYQGKFFQATSVYKSSLKYIKENDLINDIHFSLLLVDTYQKQILHDSAFIYINKAEKNIKVLKNDSLDILLNHYKIAHHNFKGDTDLAMDIAYKSLTIANQIENTYLKYLISTDLGIMFFNEKVYEKAETYLNQSLSEAKKLNDEDYIFNSRLHLASLKVITDYNKQVEKELESCANYFKQKGYLQQEAIAIGALMQAYLKSGELYKALPLSQRSIQLLSQIEFSPKMDSLTVSANILLKESKKENGSVQFAMNEITKSEKIHAEHNPKIELESKKTLTNAISDLTQSEKDSIKNFEAIFESTQTLQDSIYKASIDAKYHELEVQYETALERLKNEKLQTENTQQQLEIEKEKNTKLLFATATAIVLFGLIVFIFYAKNRKKQIVWKSQLDIAKARQEEHQKIGETLHDNKAKDLEVIANKLVSEGKIDLSKDVLIIKEDIRKLSHELTQVPFSEMEFDRQVEALAYKYFSEELEINLHDIKTVNWSLINDTIKRNLLLVVREGMSNTYNHARASKLDVVFKNYKKQLIVVLRDNGKGFNPNQPHDGLGLTNITVKVKEINGNVSFESLKGIGTTLNINITLV